MILIKTSEEIEKMRHVSKVVAETLKGIGAMVAPGVTTRDLDRYAEESLRDRHALVIGNELPGHYGFHWFCRHGCLLNK